MSELVPPIVAGEPRTIVVPGDGSQALAFALPPGVTIDVESVIAEVDATGAGGPVTATLVVAEQSGVVIARKRQSETIAAGAPGSATWALRLADDGGGGGTTLGTFELLAEANIGGGQPIGSLCAWVPEEALAGAPPVVVSASWQWPWDAGKEGTAAIRNNTTSARAVNLASAWVWDTVGAAGERLTGAAVPVAAGGFAFVTWAHASGAALMNLANPLRPKPFATSVYAVALSVQIV